MPPRTGRTAGVLVTPLDSPTHLTVLKVIEVTSYYRLCFMFAERTQREGQAQKVTTRAEKKKTLSPVLDSSVVSHSA